MLVKAIQESAKIIPSLRGYIFKGGFVPKKSNIEDKVSGKEFTGFYKGYNIDWLREVKNEHPDGYLVDEYDSSKEVTNE